MLYLVGFFYVSSDHRDLQVLTDSFPTRRATGNHCNRQRASSLATGVSRAVKRSSSQAMSVAANRLPRSRARSVNVDCASAAGTQCRSGVRSEEHTSELQSLMRISYAVFCLKK